MNKKIGSLFIALVATFIVGCAAVGGAVYGAGVGYILGDAELGASVGATAGLVKDIWD